MIYLGTSGFSYKDWVGPFYPQGMPSKDWLLFYSQEFNCCEINSTYYAIPTAKNIEAMAKKTGEGFLFSVKANREMTHEYKGNLEVFKAFCDALQPLIEQKKLGCVLAQFPYSFKYSEKSCSFIELLKEQLAGSPLVVEFRNASWLKRDVFDWMKRMDIGFCCVDEPHLPNLMPPVSEATSNIAYVRFHGRNKEKWWEHENAYERYDYTYSPEELAEWTPKIKKLNESVERTFLFANNHWRGQAIDTIRQIKMMLE
jgi:uncharacterized protein YecE (DUF72 family)